VSLRQYVTERGIDFRMLRHPDHMSVEMRSRAIG